MDRLQILARSEWELNKPSPCSWAQLQETTNTHCECILCCSCDKHRSSQQKAPDLILPLHPHIEGLHPSEHQICCMRVNGAAQHIVHGSHCRHRLRPAGQSACAQRPSPFTPCPAQARPARAAQRQQQPHPTQQQRVCHGWGAQSPAGRCVELCCMSQQHARTTALHQTPLRALLEHRTRARTGHDIIVASQILGG